MALAWFPCYVNDLLGSLSWRCMTPAQRGAYWQLICCQMQAEDGTLPDGIAMLSRLADLDLSGENSVVLDKFPPTESGKRANPRAYSEWLKRQDISEKRSNAGAIGGASKKQLPEQTPSNCLSKPEADVKQTGGTTTTTSTGTETTTKTNTSPQAEPAGVTGTLDLPIAPPPAKRPGTIAGAIKERFERLWAVAGKKVCKAEAFAEFKKVNPDDDLLVKMIAARSFYVDHTDPDFQRRLYKWIRGRNWEDELQTMGSKPKSSDAWRGAEN